MLCDDIQRQLCIAPNMDLTVVLKERKINDLKQALGLQGNENRKQSLMPFLCRIHMVSYITFVKKK